MTCSILGVGSAPRTGRIFIGVIVTTRKRTCDLCVLLGDSSAMCTCHVLVFYPASSEVPASTWSRRINLGRSALERVIMGCGSRRKYFMSQPQ